MWGVGRARTQMNTANARTQRRTARDPPPHLAPRRSALSAPSESKLADAGRRPHILGSGPCPGPALSTGPILEPPLATPPSTLIAVAAPAPAGGGAVAVHAPLPAPVPGEGGKCEHCRRIGLAGRVDPNCQDCWVMSALHTFDNHNRFVQPAGLPPSPPAAAAAASDVEVKSGLKCMNALI